MKKPKSTKKPKRSNVRHAALDKKYTTRVRQELIDYDYLDQLSIEEKDWLNKFTDEYINASFKRDETDIQPYEKYGKDSNDRNNARNRCLYTSLKNRGNRNNKNLLDYDWIVANDTRNSLENKLNEGINPANLENAYVDFLEEKEIESFMVEYDQAMLLFTENAE